MTQIVNTPVVLVRYELKCGYARCEQMAEQLTSHLNGDCGFFEARYVPAGYRRGWNGPLAVLEVVYTSLPDAVRLDLAVRGFIKGFAGKRPRFCVGRNDRLPMWADKSRRWFETKAQAMQFLETLPEADVAAGRYYIDEIDEM